MPNDESLPRHGGEQFSSRMGLILSCMGCMVGTGNIWRFPRIVSENSAGEGSLVILLYWLIFLFLWSIPMLLIEYAIGRYTGKAVIQSFRELLGDSAIWMGAWITFIPVVMACWYSVVLGWCFYYTFYCIQEHLPRNHNESKVVFNSFVEESYWPVLTHGLAVFIAALSVIRGGKTIEKVNMISVPLFLLLIFATFIWAISQDFAGDGLRFLFSPHWASFASPRAMVDALCQNAFDTGAGMGLMVAYSTYMTRQNGVVKYATIIPACNNLISLVCAMTIFSIVFSVLKTASPDISQSDILNIIQDSGVASTGITFIWLPVLFGSVGAAGRMLAVLYFLCLSFAGVTSMIAYMEIATQTLQNIGVPRRFGVPLCFLVIFLGGLPSALSINILVNQDFVWAFGLVISGLLLQYLVIKFGTTKFRQTVINEYSTDDWFLPRIWEWLVKFVAPLEALLALLWWSIHLIIDNVNTGTPWYSLSTRSLFSTLLQWVILFIILIGINVAVISCQSKRRRGEMNEEKPLELDEELDSSNYGAASQNHNYVSNENISK